MKPAVKSHVRSKGETANPVAELRRTLNITETDLAYLFGTTPRTVYRWMEEAPENYVPLQKWQGMIELAKKTLKEEALAEWFHEPNRALGGSIPIRLAADPRGFELVYHLLGNAAAGHPL